MKRFVPHYIVPLERGGSQTDTNIVYWPESFEKAYEFVFERLKPSEIAFFIRLVSVSGIQVNQIKLNSFRRLAVLFQVEEESRNTGRITKTEHLQAHLELVNRYPNPPVQIDRTVYQAHHIQPRSRGGVDFETNLAF